MTKEMIAKVEHVLACGCSIAGMKQFLNKKMNDEHFTDDMSVNALDTQMGYYYRNLLFEIVRNEYLEEDEKWKKTFTSDSQKQTSP